MKRGRGTEIRIVYVAFINMAGRQSKADTNEDTRLLWDMKGKLYNTTARLAKEGSCRNVRKLVARGIGHPGNGAEGC